MTVQSDIIIVSVCGGHITFLHDDPIPYEEIFSSDGLYGKGGGPSLPPPVYSDGFPHGSWMDRTWMTVQCHLWLYVPVVSYTRSSGCILIILRDTFLLTSDSDSACVFTLGFISFMWYLLSLWSQSMGLNSVDRWYTSIPSTHLVSLCTSGLGLAIDIGNCQSLAIKFWKVCIPENPFCRDI